MSNLSSITDEELISIEGGCVWCKIGCTLIAVGGVVASGGNLVAVGLAIPGIVFTWVC